MMTMIRMTLIKNIMMINKQKNINKMQKIILNPRMRMGDPIITVKKTHKRMRIIF